MTLASGVTQRPVHPGHFLRSLRSRAPLCPSDISLASGATPGPPPSSLLKEGRRRKSELLMSTVFHSLRLDSIVAYVAVNRFEVWCAC